MSKIDPAHTRPSRPVSQDTERTHFAIDVVRREVIPLTLNRNGIGPSLGEMLNRHLSRCADMGDRVRDVTLHFSDDDWDEYTAGNDTAAD